MPGAALVELELADAAGIVVPLNDVALRAEAEGLCQTMGMN